jgi:hypothetical protein
MFEKGEIEELLEDEWINEYRKFSNTLPYDIENLLL